jgi:hypothetical protein
MQLPVYSRNSTSESDFIAFWANQVSANGIEQDEKQYTPHIGKPLTRESLEALFRWKNQMRLSDKKRQSIETNYIGRLDELQKLSPDTEPDAFLKKFSKGGAIWRIFLLHCWSRAKYPIYDQHVHRAMTFIRKEPPQEIAGWSDRKKIDAYREEYVPFFDSFSEHGPRKVDRALWILGRFIKSTQFPDALDQGYGRSRKREPV